MKAVRFDALIPSIAYQLPGCPDHIMLRMLREAARELCRRSSCWRENVTTNVVALQTAYSIVSSFDADIRRVFNVWIRTASDVTAGTSGQVQDLSRITFSPPSTLTFPDKPSASVTGGLVVRLILTPTFDSAEIGAEIVELWSHVIAAGAAGKLMGQSKQPWSDPNGARDKLVEFENGIIQADVDTEKAFMAVEQRVETQNWLAQ